MAFRNLLNRPSSALKFLSEELLRVVELYHIQMPGGQRFPRSRRCGWNEILLQLLLSTGAGVLETSLPVSLLWKYKATGVVRIGSGSTSLVRPAARFSSAFPMQRQFLEGFILFPPLNCVSTEDLFPLGLWRSIIVRNYYWSCYQCSKIYYLKVGFPNKGFVYRQ